MSEQMLLAELLETYVPGSFDQWTWREEFDWLLGHPTQDEYTARLIEDIQTNGIQDPILLGDDGRVWDGHHRLAAADALGIKTVPVERWGDQHG